MLWGLGDFRSIGELLPDRDATAIEALPAFLAIHNLHAVECEADEWLALDPDVCQAVGRGFKASGIRAVFRLGAVGSPDEDEMIQRSREAIVALTACVPDPAFVVRSRGYHRFMRTPPLADQLAHLANTLRPLVAAAREAEAELAIENAGDYYISDLTDLCERTPHLGIYLNTANCFVIGERPSRAVADAAGHLVGARLGDRSVQPSLNQDPLEWRFESRNVAPGAGDAQLADVVGALASATGGGENLPVVVGLDPVEGLTPAELLERALDLIRSF
jgi:hypothetical protein